MLHRDTFVCDLVEITQKLLENDNGCTLAVDGQWGSGKSYALDMFEKELSDTNLKFSKSPKCIVFRYNCWEYDYYEEPLIAITAAICEASKQSTDMLVKQKMKEAISAIVCHNYRIEDMNSHFESVNAAKEFNKYSILIQ